MTIHQCPECELTFVFKNELDWHRREEHAHVLTADADASVGRARHREGASGEH